MSMVKCPECEGNVSDLAEVCPHCGYPLKKKEPDRIEYVLSKGTDTDSGFATFLRVLAWIVWIGGLIVSIASATVTVEVGRYGSSTQFSFTTFLTHFLSYIINGVLIMGMASIVETIANTYSIVSGLSLDKRKLDSPGNAKWTVNPNYPPKAVSKNWICPICKQTNNPWDDLCTHCGEPNTWICPVCKQTNNPWDDLCTHCGEPNTSVKKQ